MSDILRLKEQTGAGMMDCKAALDECGGNFDKAVSLLRTRGIAKAVKKEGSGRVNSEGAVFLYNHMFGKIGVMVEINIETDFAAKNEIFQELGAGIAMHIAAANPIYLDETYIPKKDIAEEKKVAKAKAILEGKPTAVVKKIVDGRVAKFYSEVCLVHQEYVRDPSKKVKDVVTDAIAKIGEKISIRRFVRFEMGEGLTKKEENFAAEVAKQIGK